MGGESEANHLKKGGVAKKHHYAKGGAVNQGAIPESKAANMPAKGIKPILNKPVPHAIATMKKGGHAKGGLTVVIAPMRKSSGRGR